MGLLQWVMFWVLAPAAALALDLAPAETPPADFPGQQYIDSRGCVFLRGDSGWNPRLTRDGQPVCGYPPSLSQRGIDGRPRLRALDPDAGKTRAQLIEEALTRAVVPNLRAGELVSDPRPLEQLPDMGPEPHDSAPMQTLRGALRAAPAVRAGMARDLQPNRRLCDLLGYDETPTKADPDKAEPARLGSDPSKGYCGNLPASDLSRLAFSRPIGSPLQPGAEAAAAAPAEEAAVKGPEPKPATRLRAVATPAKAGTVPLPTARTSAPATPLPRDMGKPAPISAPTSKEVPKGNAPGMIPAGARFVQFGSFADSAAASRAAGRAMALGYPVLRGIDKNKRHFLMAGPFDSREAIVRALDGLRRAGFRSAYPR